MHKTVKYILPAMEMDMGGIPIKQAIPTTRVDQIDPFLLLHHARLKFTDRKLAKHQGIGPHPHRGFSPVTFVIEGEIHHRDSRGNSQIAKKGEVQWINSGAGIIHSERPSQHLIDAGKQDIEIIQLWINTPAVKKMDPPSYQYLSNEHQVSFQSEDGKIKNNLITGTYEGRKGKLISASETLIIWSKGTQNGTCTYSIPPSHNASIYLVKGTLFVKGHGLVDPENLIFFNKEEDEIQLDLQEESEFLIFCGAPINEEIVKHGPFVMNNQTEILEAMRDYQMGKMGVLIEDDMD